MTDGSGAHHVLDQLSPYLDGDLGDKDAARVRAHLGACPSCGQALAEMQVMVRAARALERPDPPPTLWPAIEGALARREPGPFGWRVFAGGLLAGAAVALAGGGVRVGRPGDRDAAAPAAAASSPTPAARRAPQT